MLLSRAPKLISIVGDIHLSLRDKTLEDWERSRFLELFKVLANDGSDIVVLNGDIFDKAIATLFEIAVFFEGIDILKEAGKEIVIIDGNHEELNSHQTTFDMLPHDGFKRLKADCIEFDYCYIWLVGHPHIKYLEAPDFPIAKDRPNILISHYRSDIGFASEEIDNSKISDMFDDVILSDIHFKLKPADNIRYTSSPYGITYTTKKEYGYVQLLIEEDTYEITDKILTLPSKEKIITKKEELDDILESLDQQNIYKLEIVGESDAETLEKLKEHENILKFSFSETHNDELIDDITDEIRIELHNSLQEVILVALDDLELTPEERERAEKVLQEEL